jgi:hypothetical protein
MPSGDSQLPFIEDTIRRAAKAADTADSIANTCIKVSLHQRIAAGEALAAAQQLIAPAAWHDWLAQIGISPREAKRYAVFPGEYRRQGR